MSESVFSRSPRGLANIALILGVDRIAYCEGDSIFASPQDAEPIHMGLDHAFWRIILCEAFPGERIRMKPIGAKSQVAEQAKLAWLGEESTIGRKLSLACLDRDYDSWIASENDYDGNDCFILTDGYCVENDLYNLCGPARLIQSIVPRASKQERNKLSNFLLQLDRCMSRPVRIDIFLRRAALKIFGTDTVPRFFSQYRNPEDITDRVINGWIIAERRRTVQADGFSTFKEVRLKPGLTGSRPSSDVANGSSDVPGKTWLKIICDVLNKLGKSTPNWRGLNQDRLADILLAEFERPEAVAERASTHSTRLRSWANRTLQV